MSYWGRTHRIGTPFIVRSMRERLAGRSGLIDLVLAVSLAVFALFGVRQWPLVGEPDAALARDFLVVVLCLPLARRRREPRLVLVIVAASAAAIWIAGFADGPTAVAGSVAFYSVGRYVERPASLQLFAATGGSLAAVAGWLSLLGGENTWFSFAARCGVIVAAFAIGDSQRSRAALLESLRAQAERAELLRVLEVQRAASDERARIAREMHDVVAHSLSVMIVQAVAAERTAGTDPDAAARSIASVAEVGRGAAVEMRRILQVLDAEGSSLDLAPQPTLANLDVIIERFEAAGLGVDINREGVTTALDPGMELAVVRIVQEALTNVLKHAGTTTARLTMRYSDHLTIEVADHGPGRSAASVDRSPRSTGRGLVGMRERAEALGGSLVAQPIAGGGFVVRAVLPLSFAAPHPASNELEGMS